MDWQRLSDREQRRYADGATRAGRRQLLRMGNAAYGAALAELMLGRPHDASRWFERAAQRWRESFDTASPEAWGRPLGAIKASLLAGGDGTVYARWALELGSEQASSAIGRFVAALALAVLGEWERAGRLSATLADGEFPEAVADALAALAEPDPVRFGWALGAVLVSFERRDAYLEDVPVADTVLVLVALARRRGVAAVLPDLVLLPRG